MPRHLLQFMLAVMLGSCAPVSGVTSQPQETPVVVTASTPNIIRTQVSPNDYMVMVFVPAGQFEMGGYVDSALDTLPAHTVYLDAFWIDQTEVTNEMFVRFVESTGYVTDAEKAGSSNDFRTTNLEIIWEKVEGWAWNHPNGRNSNLSDLEDHPVVHVSWNDASAYCSWAERRLPTEAEWEKAASWNDVSGEKYAYPWGNDFEETRLNFCDKNCLYDFAAKHLDDGYAETSPVGRFPEGASPYGVLDMSGNVFEWIADWYSPDYYEWSPPSNPLGPGSGQIRVMRGGAWVINNYYLSSARRWAWNPSFQHRALGFRCVLGTSSSGASLAGEIIDQRGVAMQFVPAGEFTMGTDESTSPDNMDEKPAHQVYLDAFYIDKYEVTNKLYKACVDAGTCQSPLGFSSATRSSYYGNPDFDNHPVIYVDWNMAKSYCEWRSAQLPTEAQWEKAARGTDARIYPWGKGISCDKANYWPKDQACIGDTTEVGTYESNVSSYGVYDMAGNVMEWVADWYSSMYYWDSPASNPLGAASGEERVFRGGSWMSSDHGVRSAARHWPWNSFGHVPHYSQDLGFRCVLMRSP